MSKNFCVKGRWIIAIMILGSFVTGCNRGALRLYGIGDTFPQSITNFSSKVQYPYEVYVEWPEDKTEEYYGHSIAGTSWQGTRTDTLDRNAMRNLIYQALLREIQSAKIFSGIDKDKKKGSLVLETEIRAFGAQVRGFLWARVGGVSSFKFTLKRNAEVLFEKVYEKVVRDGDSEYTGSGIGFMEDAMRATMSDSFREVLKVFLTDLEQLNMPPLTTQA